MKTELPPGNSLVSMSMILIIMTCLYLVFFSGQFDIFENFDNIYTFEMK